MSIHLNLDEQEAKTALYPSGNERLAATVNANQGYGKTSTSVPSPEEVLRNANELLKTNKNVAANSFQVGGGSGLQNTKARIMDRLSQTMSFLAKNPDELTLNQVVITHSNLTEIALRSLRVVGLVIVIVAGLIGAAVHFEVISFDSLKEIAQEFAVSIDQNFGTNFFENLISPSKVQTSGAVSKKHVTKSETPDKVYNESSNKEKFINPYWNLPNELDAEVKPLGRMWTNYDELTLRNDLNHTYFYQRYQSVDRVIQGRLKGSETILYAALEQPKLWLRMRAAAGLADFGHPPELYDVKQILENEPDDRVANYFKRFNAKNTPGERYLLRASIRFVSAKARLNILKALSAIPNPVNHLYLVAAADDPSTSVQRWLGKSHVLSQISKADQDKIKVRLVELGKQNNNSDSEVSGGESTPVDEVMEINELQDDAVSPTSESGDHSSDRGPSQGVGIDPEEDDEGEVTGPANENDTESDTQNSDSDLNE